MPLVAITYPKIISPCASCESQDDREICFATCQALENYQAWIDNRPPVDLAAKAIQDKLEIKALQIAHGPYVPPQKLRDKPYWFDCPYCGRRIRSYHSPGVRQSCDMKACINARKRDVGRRENKLSLGDYK